MNFHPTVKRLDLGFSPMCANPKLMKKERNEKILLKRKEIFMENMKILLCCGAGMSSGFLASNARKVAKKQKLDATIEARSYSEVRDFLPTIDILMLGPHYKAELGTFEKMAEPYNVKVVVIPQDIYATLDGTRLLELADSLLK